MPRAGVSVVPEIPPPAAVIARQRVSAWRIGLLSTLTIFVGTFAWFSDSPRLPLIETHVGPAATAPAEEKLPRSGPRSTRNSARHPRPRHPRGPGEPVTPHGRYPFLASSIDALTNGIDQIKAEVAGSREAANEFTRIEQRLWQMASAAALEAVDVSQLLDRDIALMSRIDRI